MCIMAGNFPICFLKRDLVLFVANGYRIVWVSVFLQPFWPLCRGDFKWHILCDTS
jgi:hypothetical protein